MTIRSGVRVGAAAFALGLALAGQAGVAAADGGESDAAASVGSGDARAGAQRPARTASDSRPARMVPRADSAAGAPAAVRRVGGSPQHAATHRGGDGAGYLSPAAVRERARGPVAPRGMALDRVDAAGALASATAAAPPATRVGAAQVTSITQFGYSDLCPTCDPAPEAEPGGAGVQASTARLNTAVAGFFDSVSRLLSVLPTTVSDFLSGALLLVRRTIFNQLPTAGPLYLAGDNGPVAGRVLAVDPEGDPLSFTVTSDPTRGAVEIGPDGSLTYTPAYPDVFDDSFTVTVTDSGFNILDPFSDRSVAVQVNVGPGTPVKASQGFDIVNLTNHVLWLTSSNWISKYGNTTYQGITDETITTCADQGFCLTSKVKGKKDLRGTALAPGEVLHAEIYTPLPFFHPSFDGQWVMMEFSAKEEAGADQKRWLVQITPTYSNSTNKIEGRWDPYGTGQFVRDNGQPWATDQSNGNRIFLLENSVPGGGTFAIQPDTSYTISPPADCGLCQYYLDQGRPAWALSDREFVAPTVIDVFNTLMATSERFGQRKYTNIKFNPLLDSRATPTTLNGVDQPLRLTNASGSAGNSANYQWTVTSDPGPQPQSPWWQQYAAQGAGELAKFILGKFVGDAIADASKNAITGLLSPEQVKTGVTRQGATTVATRPWSLSIVLVQEPKYDVTGDVVFSFTGCRDKCGDTGYAFKDMNFQIVDRRAVYDGTFAQVPYQQEVNQGFEVRDPTQGVFPTYSTGKSYILDVNAYKGGGSDGSVPESFTRNGCSESRTSNCTTFTVSDPSIAEVTITAGVATLIAKAPGNAIVTATYNWVIPKGGVDTAGNPLPPETGKVVATMPFKVSDGVAS